MLYDTHPGQNAGGDVEVVEQAGHLLPLTQPLEALALAVPRARWPDEHVQILGIIAADSPMGEQAVGQAVFSQDTDFHSAEFRAASMPRMLETLQLELPLARNVLARNDPDELKMYLARSTDSLARAALGASAEDDISSPADFSILQMLYGEYNVAWRKPLGTERVKDTLLAELVGVYTSGEMDIHRLAKGMQLLTGMLQEKIDANHRTAHGVRLLLEKAGRGDSTVTRDEVRQLLFADELTETPPGTVSSDLKTLIEGTAQFAVQVKGMDADTVTWLYLRALLPDTSLGKIHDKLDPETPLEALREEFMHFMVIDADLSWGEFQEP